MSKLAEKKYFDLSGSLEKRFYDGIDNKIGIALIDHGDYREYNIVYKLLNLPFGV
jgi:hypothetical protein